MHSHRLILDHSPSAAEWLLEWDESTLALKDPEGHAILAASLVRAHRRIDVDELYHDEKVCLRTPEGRRDFRRQHDAAVDVQGLVEAGLRRDRRYRRVLRGRALNCLLRGGALFALAGGLFTLYAWRAFFDPHPPAILHGLLQLKWLVYGVLLLLLAVALAGPYICLSGLRQLYRLYRIERALAAVTFAPFEEHDPEHLTPWPPT